jgi:hypothetical protein
MERAKGQKTSEATKFDPSSLVRRLVPLAHRDTGNRERTWRALGQSRLKMRFGSSGCRRLRSSPEPEGAFTTGHSPDARTCRSTSGRGFGLCRTQGCTRSTMAGCTFFCNFLHGNSRSLLRPGCPSRCGGHKVRQFRGRSLHRMAGLIRSRAVNFSITVLAMIELGPGQASGSLVREGDKNGCVATGRPGQHDQVTSLHTKFGLSRPLANDFAARLPTWLHRFRDPDRLDPCSESHLRRMKAAAMTDGEPLPRCAGGRLRSAPNRAKP